VVSGSVVSGSVVSGSVDSGSVVSGSVDSEFIPVRQIMVKVYFRTCIKNHDLKPIVTNNVKT